MSKVILTVGNNMMGDDGAGPLLAELLMQDPAPGWSVIDGGSAPENVAHQVQALAPELVLLVDAADIALEPGAVRLIDDACIADMFIMTTHNLPLSFLIERLRETIPEVLFLGIQPDVVAFGFPLGEKVKQAVIGIHSDLMAGQDPKAYPWL